ncbi:hypothetical protein LCGC14_0708060 [marine sediment metagenome]|uniref:Uncharacterized protein n=1 Tax=marine sediment metagenome TaxID=412755 RepID=A0A0F9T1S4_9ZZZZ
MKTLEKIYTDDCINEVEMEERLKAEQIQADKDLKEKLAKATVKATNNKMFRDTRTGEIVTQFKLTEIKYFEEVN